MRRRAESVSLAQARRIALAAQGFGAPRSSREASKREVRAVFQKLGVVQIDSVNVLARAHLLPVYSRLGRYRVEDLHTLAYGGRGRALFEYWGHEASLLPVALQPLLRWRMARAARGEGIYRGLAVFGRERRRLVRRVLREVAERGPLTSKDLSHKHRGDGGWWGWSDGKRALEWLFWAGELTTAMRRGTFERVYDLTERVLPQTVLDAPTPKEADAQRALMQIAARNLGLATRRCLRDYFRLDAADGNARVAELVEEGELTPVRVEGWDAEAYLASTARWPRHLDARALLVPFDPLIWQRERVEALFGARIRIELYTPSHKRTHGYYVLPFLLGDRIVARVDLKADRAASALRVQSAHGEPGTEPATMVEALAAELRLLADWLGLERISVADRGDLARHLGATVG
ncbi:MAG TPA: crosslink repair DNA glycosylase YcaQ family protein [Hyphomicrobiaceae bacterium]|nr:crosslink repair DNA glycosylase YcaQ family protein [Hyphomicrobiaceae bacterium]